MAPRPWGDPSMVRFLLACCLNHHSGRGVGCRHFLSIFATSGSNERSCNWLDTAGLAWKSYPPYNMRRAFAFLALQVAGTGKAL